MDDSEAKAIKSTGLSSSYYDLTVPEWLVEKINERAKSESGAFVKTEELIEALFADDFNFGTLFKSTVRAFQTSQGKGKEGNSMEYETNKVKYYSDKINEKYTRSS